MTEQETEVLEDFHGVEVITADDEQVGTIERTYADAAGAIRFAVVRMGGLVPSHRLVPLEGTEMLERRLRTPYSRQIIDDAPDVLLPPTLAGRDLAQVRRYYDRMWRARWHAAGEAAQGAHTVPLGETTPPELPWHTERPRAGEHVSSSTPEDEVIEIPVVEEQVVTRPVVTEVVRVRKSELVETESVGADVRSEDVQVVSDDELGDQAAG